MSSPVRPVPSWREWVRPEALSIRGAMRGVGRTPADASRFADTREQQRVAAMPSLADKIRESAGRIGQQVVEHPVRTVADLLPGIGDALAVKDAGGAALEGNWPMAGLALASVIPGVPAVAKKAKAAAGDGRALAKALREQAEDAALQGLPVIERPRGIRTWHGSPVKGIQEFSLDFLRKGEGWNAYGPGIYVAENPKVAGYYRDKLGGVAMRYGGETYDDLAGLHQALWGQPEGKVLTSLLHDDPTLSWAPGQLTDQLEAYRKQLQGQGALAMDEDAYERILQRRIAAQRLQEGLEFDRKGALYELELDADPDEALYWDREIRDQPTHARELLAPDTYRTYWTLGDKPLALQINNLSRVADPARPKLPHDAQAGQMLNRALFRHDGNVEAAIRELREETNPVRIGRMRDAGATWAETGDPVHPTLWDAVEQSGLDWDAALRRRRDEVPMTGGQIVGLYESLHGGPRGAAEALAAKGIPAIRYRDALSRSSDAGGPVTHNWVVMDPKRLRVVRQLGLAGALAAAGSRMAAHPWEEEL